MKTKLLVAAALAALTVGAGAAQARPYEHVTKNSFNFNVDVHTGHYRPYAYKPYYVPYYAPYYAPYYGPNCFYNVYGQYVCA